MFSDCAVISVPVQVSSQQTRFSSPLCPLKPWNVTTFLFLFSATPKFSTAPQFWPPCHECGCSWQYHLLKKLDIQNVFFLLSKPSWNKHPAWCLLHRGCVKTNDSFKWGGAAIRKSEHLPRWLQGLFVITEWKNKMFSPPSSCHVYLFLPPRPKTNLMKKLRKWLCIKLQTLLWVLWTKLHH